MNQLAPSVSIPSDCWTDVEGDGSRLLATIDVNHCSLHLEAFAVERDAGIQAWATNVEELSAIYAASGADGGWQTVPINGREYVLIATPYSE